MYIHLPTTPLHLEIPEVLETQHVQSEMHVLHPGLAFSLVLLLIFSEYSYKIFPRDEKIGKRGHFNLFCMATITLI